MKNLFKAVIEGLKRRARDLATDHPDSAWGRIYVAHKIIHDEYTLGMYRDAKNSGWRVLFFQRFGELNSDKRIYITGFNQDRVTVGGILAELRKDLIQIDMAEKYNLTPVIEFRNSLYTEKEPINGTYNAFEYYFNQVSEISVEEAWKSSYVYVQRNGDILHADIPFSYELAEEHIERLGSVFKKYISFNENTQNMINKDMASLIGEERDKILGVHIRGTDFNNDYNGHPVPVSAEQYFDVIDHYLKNKQYERVFLATDDSRLVNAFEIKYEEKLLLFRDVIRSDDNQGVHVNVYMSNKKGMGYRAGYEVLRDVFTLSKLRGLVAGYSGAQIMARIIKKSFGEVFTDFELISNGISNSSNYVAHMNSLGGH